METYCNRCNTKVVESETSGYSYQCFECDEDLYLMEVHQINNELKH